MNRVLVATVLGMLLPSLVCAQPDQRSPQGAQGGRPGASANRPPGPGGPQRPGPSRPPGQAQVRPPAARPPQAQRPRPPMVAQPRPPRGNQFWHRGRYFNRVRGPAFRYPPGWGYRRWSIGSRLPALFLAPAFFYAGWAGLGLSAPPPGYAWVRYGPDLLEVNLVTGEVEDVIYGVFY